MLLTVFVAVYFRTKKKKKPVPLSFVCCTAMGVKKATGPLRAAIG
jgi:hypothetical protein